MLARGMGILSLQFTVMIFALAKSYDMSAPDSIILQAVNLRVSAIITVIVPQALITEISTADFQGPHN